MAAKDHLFGLLVIAVLVAATVAIPLALIWSLNTLGVASASYGFIEWVAAFLLTAVFLGGSGG